MLFETLSSVEKYWVTLIHSNSSFFIYHWWVDIGQLMLRGPEVLVELRRYGSYPVILTCTVPGAYMGCNRSCFIPLQDSGAKKRGREIRVGYLSRVAQAIRKEREPKERNTACRVLVMDHVSSEGTISTWMGYSDYGDRRRRGR